MGSILRFLDILQFFRNVFLKIRIFLIFRDYIQFLDSWSHGGFKGLFSGYFALFSNEVKEPFEALSLYRSTDTPLIFNDLMEMIQTNQKNVPHHEIFYAIMVAVSILALIFVYRVSMGISKIVFPDNRYSKPLQLLLRSLLLIRT